MVYHLKRIHLRKKKKKGDTHLQKGREASKWAKENFWPRSCLKIGRWKRKSLLKRNWKPLAPFWRPMGAQGLIENRLSSLGSYQRHLENEISDVADELAGAFNSLHHRRKITFPQRNTLQILSINSAFHPVSPLKSLSLERPRMIKSPQRNWNTILRLTALLLKKGVGEPRQ